VAAYLLADLAMGIGIFRWYYQLHAGLPSGIYDGFAAQAVTVGVWGRAALLLALFVVFLRVPDRLAAGPLPRRTPVAESVGAAEDTRAP
jgi:hypothetical protein